MWVGLAGRTYNCWPGCTCRLSKKVQVYMVNKVKKVNKVNKVNEGMGSTVWGRNYGMGREREGCKIL